VIPGTAEGEGHAALDAKLLHPGLLVLACLGVVIGGFAGKLHDPGAKLRHHPGQFLDLVPVGHAAGHRLARGRAVDPGARRGKTDGAGADRLRQLPFHGGEIVAAGGLLHGAFAHDMGAQRRMSHIGGIVDAFGQFVDGIEIFGEAVPGPGNPRLHGVDGDILGHLQVVQHQIHVRRRARCQREPAIAHDHAGHPMPAGIGADGVPEDLGVHMGVAVDEAGRDHMTLGVDNFFCPPFTSPMAAILPSEMATSAR
jgi:hypothetical protein